MGSLIWRLYMHFEPLVTGSEGFACMPVPVGYSPVERGLEPAAATQEDVSLCVTAASIASTCKGTVLQEDTPTCTWDAAHCMTEGAPP